ncbi:MAG TPA: LysR family transcriptional regulator [Gammaproteobacteria bacterium]
MDIELARTFLAVVAAGNLIGAAERLHVTQSTVSARIQTLERQLGVVLLHRHRNGAALTAAGQRFLRHAKSLVRTLEQARHDVGLPAGYLGSLTLRGRIALWDGFLPQWVAWMRREMPDISLRLEIGFEEDIMQGLIQGTIDIGLMYTPENRPGLGIERLFDERLLLVSTTPGSEWNDANYVHIDWGAEFEAQFATHYPDAAPPALLASIGWLGLQQILLSGGAGFFPQRMVTPLIEAGRLWLIPDTPAFSLPAYLVYSQDRRDPSMHRALEGLRLLATQGR